MLGSRFFILDCKEIENLIPPEILREIVKEEFQHAGKDILKIEYAKYSQSGKGLGVYLDKILGAQKFASDTGTLKDKVNFCEKVVDFMAQTNFQWELTPQLKALCEKIYGFIENQNIR